MRREHAQSLLEYLIIAIVVMGAIIAGGPFLVNSINARFKGMDDLVQDSFSEKVDQSYVPALSLTCHCDPDDPDISTWTQGACAFGTCLGYQRFYSRTCENCPNGWPVSGCVTDPSCCSAPSSSTCGTLLMPDWVTGTTIPASCTGTSTLPSVFDPNIFEGTCMTNGVVTHNCPIGKMIHEVGCGGTSPTHYACSKQIETACLPACGGGAYPAGAPNSSPCPLDDATMDEFILRLADGTFTPTATGSYQLHFRYTTSCDMETPDRKCEMSCNHATGCCPVIYINEDVTNNHGPNNPCNAAHDPAPTPCYYAICPTPLDSD